MSDLPIASVKRRLYNSRHAGQDYVDDKRSRTALCHDLNEKKDYLCYYKNLKYYIERGAKCTVKAGISFTEKRVLAPHIQNLLRLKREAKQSRDAVAELFIKVLYAALVGYCLSSSKDHITYFTVTNRADCRRYAASHRFVDFKVLSNKRQVGIVGLKNCTARYQNPIVLAFTVLEISKLWLYRGHDRIRSVFSDCRLISANTDSLCLLCTIPKPHRKTLVNPYYEMLAKLSDIFDFSNLDSCHPLYSTHNMGRPGCFKIVEQNLVEYISLGPSSNSQLVACDVCWNHYTPTCFRCLSLGTIYRNGMQKARGIPLHLMKRISHIQYRKYLEKTIRPFFPHESLHRNVDGQSVDLRNYRLFGSNLEPRVFHFNNSLPFGDKRIPIMHKLVRP